MNKPLTDDDKRRLARAPRIWVSYPDGRKMKIIDPSFLKQLREEKKARTVKPTVEAAPDFDDAPFISGYVARNTAKAIIVSVCKATKVSVDAVMSTSRRVPVVRARNAAMYLCRVRLGMSYPQIGARFCRDHTTVFHGIRKHVISRRALGRGVADVASQV